MTPNNVKNLDINNIGVTPLIVYQQPVVQFFNILIYTGQTYGLNYILMSTKLQGIVFHHSNCRKSDISIVIDLHFH